MPTYYGVHTSTCCRHAFLAKKLVSGRCPFPPSSAGFFVATFAPLLPLPPGSEAAWLAVAGVMCVFGLLAAGVVVLWLALVLVAAVVSAIGSCSSRGFLLGVSVLDGLVS